MNFISRIENFTKADQDEFLAFSFAYTGEVLIKAAEKEVFRPQGISSVQYNVLCTLSVVSPRPAHEISSFILGSAPNVSAILTRMENLGFITRMAPTTGDKRNTLISVTAKGEKIFSTTRKKFKEFFAKKFSNISPEEKNNFKQMIQNFSEYL